MTRQLIFYVPGSIAPAMDELLAALLTLDPPVDAAVDRVAPSGELAEAIIPGESADLFISAGE